MIIIKHYFLRTLRRTNSSICHSALPSFDPHSILFLPSTCISDGTRTSNGLREEYRTRLTMIDMLRTELLKSLRSKQRQVLEVTSATGSRGFSTSMDSSYDVCQTLPLSLQLLVMSYSLHQIDILAAIWSYHRVRMLSSPQEGNLPARRHRRPVSSDLDSAWIRQKNE